MKKKKAKVKKLTNSAQLDFRDHNELSKSIMRGLKVQKNENTD